MLAERTDLSSRVLRLHVQMRVPAPEYEEAKRLLAELEGTEARHGRAGVLDLKRHDLELDTTNVETYCTELPDVLQSAVRQLKTAAETSDPRERQTAERALFQLYRLSRQAP